MPLIQGNRDVAQFLIVEDDPGDVILMRDALSRFAFPRQLHFVSNGQQAVHFLQKKNEFGWAPRPDLVLLDLKMPVMNGLEVLRAIKQDASLRDIPVVVASTSNTEAERQGALDLGAEACIVKSSNYEEFCDLVFTVIDPAVADIMDRRSEIHEAAAG